MLNYLLQCIVITQWINEVMSKKIGQLVKWIWNCSTINLLSKLMILSHNVNAVCPVVIIFYGTFDANRHLSGEFIIVSLVFFYSCFLHRLIMFYRKFLWYIGQKNKSRLLLIIAIILYNVRFGSKAILSFCNKKWTRNLNCMLFQVINGTNKPQFKWTYKKQTLACT